MKKAIYKISIILFSLLLQFVTFAKENIEIGDAKKEVLEILGAPTRVSKYEFTNEEVWAYKNWGRCLTYLTYWN